MWLILFLHWPGLCPAGSVHSSQEHPQLSMETESSALIQASHHNIKDGCWLLLLCADSEQKLAIYIALLACLVLYTFLSEFLSDAPPNSFYENTCSTLCCPVWWLQEQGWYTKYPAYISMEVRYLGIFFKHTIFTIRKRICNPWHFLVLKS